MAGPLGANAAAFALFRPQGLITLSAIYSLPSRASLISCRQRSWDSTLRSVPLSPDGCCVSTTAAPTYCFSRAFSACDKHKLAGHTGRSFWVQVRRESLAPPPVLGVCSTGCSLGLCCLPGLTRRAALAEFSLSIPSRAFRKTVKPFTAAPQGLNRRSPGLTADRASSNATNRQTTL
jgi:hypothetical protein